MDGRVFEVEVQGDTSVVALKEMVAAKAGMAVDACRVIFCGKVLTLADFSQADMLGVSNDSFNFERILVQSCEHLPCHRLRHGCSPPTVISHDVLLKWF